MTDQLDYDRTIYRDATEAAEHAGHRKLMEKLADLWGLPVELSEGYELKPDLPPDGPEGWDFAPRHTTDGREVSRLQYTGPGRWRITYKTGGKWDQWHEVASGDIDSVREWARGVRDRGFPQVPRHLGARVSGSFRERMQALRPACRRLAATVKPGLEVYAEPDRTGSVVVWARRRGARICDDEFRLIATGLHTRDEVISAVSSIEDVRLVVEVQALDEVLAAAGDGEERDTAIPALADRQPETVIHIPNPFGERALKRIPMMGRVSSPDINTIINIPHASTMIPPELKRTILVDDETLQEELLVLTDWHTDELFAMPGESVMARFPVSRLAVDIERFTDPMEEPMEDVGMGAIYTKTSKGKLLRHDPTDEAREAVLHQYQQPYHHAYYDVLDTIMKNREQFLLLDCHSFPSTPPPCYAHLYHDKPLPDICIGTDRALTSSRLAQIAVEAWQERGLSVEVNYPFSGSFWPGCIVTAHDMIQTIMIEVNRSLYMDEKTGEKSAQYKAFREITCGALRQIIQTFTREAPFYDHLSERAMKRVRRLKASKS